MRRFGGIAVVHRHVREQLAVQIVVRRFGVPVRLHHLLRAQAVVVVLECQRRALRAHALQLAARLPFIRPRAIVQRIAHSVVNNRDAVISSQLVLPVRVAVGIRNRLQSFTQFIRNSICILRLVQDIAAPVVAVNPRRILMRVIDTDKLTKCVINVSGGKTISRLTGDVATIIIGIGEVHGILTITLRNAAYQRGRCILAVGSCARSVCILRRISARSIGHSSACNTVQLIVYVVHLRGITAVVAHLRHSVISIIGILRLETLVSSRFVERLYAILLVVFNQSSILQISLAITLFGFIRTISLVVTGTDSAAIGRILHKCGTAFGIVLIRESRRFVVVIAHAGNTVKVIIGVLYLSTVAILDFLKSTLAVRAIDVSRKCLISDLHRGLAAKLVILKVIHNICCIARRIVCHRLEFVILIGVLIATDSALAVRRIRRLYTSNTIRSVINIFHRLARRVGYAKELAVCVKRIDYFIAPRVPLLGHKVPVIGILRLRSDERCGSIFLHSSINSTTIGIIFSRALDTGRSRRSQRKVPLLLRISSTIGEQILFRRRAARLYVAQQVVKGVIRRGRLLVRQVFHGRHIALRVVGVDIAIQLARQADVREHARIRVSSVEHTDLDGIEILRCRDLRGDAVPTASIRAKIEALPTGIDITRICTESNADSRLEGRITACHAQRVAPATDGKYVALRATGVDVLRDIYVRCGRLAGQTHCVAADGIRQTIHRAVGHDTIQRGRAHTVARHLPLLREQARRRCRSVVRRQAEIAISNEIERVRHSPAFHLRTAPIQRARLRVAHKLDRHGGRLAIFKREADAQALPAGSKRAHACARRAGKGRTAFVDDAVRGHAQEGTLIAAGNG